MNVNNVRMESVDVITDVLIDCPVATVSAFASDPGNAMEWYANIKSMQWKTPKPMAIGSRIAFVARFLGKKLEYTYEIAEFIPGERFVMRTADGLFPMETTYAREKVAERQTRMTLRNRGTPSGFSKIFAPVMAFAMRRENKKDLTRLKRILDRIVSRRACPKIAEDIFRPGVNTQSFLKLSTGFAMAAWTDCQLTVKRAITSATNPDNKKIPAVISMRYAKF